MTREYIFLKLDRNKSSETTEAVAVNCVVHLPKRLPDLDDLDTRHPSPYYYGDLFKSSDPQSVRTQSNRYRKSASLDVPGVRSRTLGLPERNSLTNDTDSPDPTSLRSLDTIDNNGRSTAQSDRCDASSEDNLDEATVSLTALTNTDNDRQGSSCIFSDWERNRSMPPSRRSVGACHDLSPAATSTALCTCHTKDDDYHQHQYYLRNSDQSLDTRALLDDEIEESDIGDYDDDEDDDGDEGDEEGEEEVEEEQEGGDMARQRQIYETAFDSKIIKSDDDLDDDPDRLTNHSALLAQVGVVKYGY